jgi:hypothetical protein
MAQTTARQLALALAETLAETGQPIIEGHAYARLMGQVDLDTFQAAVHALRAAGLVAVSGHVMTATEELYTAAEKAGWAVCPPENRKGLFGLPTARRPEPVEHELSEGSSGVCVADCACKLQAPAGPVALGDRLRDIGHRGSKAFHAAVCQVDVAGQDDMVTKTMAAELCARWFGTGRVQYQVGTDRAGAINRPWPQLAARFRKLASDLRKGNVVA